jgi:transposase
VPLDCNRWLVDALRGRGADVLVADTTKLDLRKLGKRTDRRDAREIARRFHLGDLDRHTRTCHPTDGEYGLRKLPRVKHAQLQKRNRTPVPIRGLLNAHLLRPPTLDRETRARLAQADQPPPRTPPEMDSPVPRRLLPDAREETRGQVRP